MPLLPPVMSGTGREGLVQPGTYSHGALGPRPWVLRWNLGSHPACHPLVLHKQPLSWWMEAYLPELLPCTRGMSAHTQMCTRIPMCECVHTITRTHLWARLRWCSHVHTNIYPCMLHTHAHTQLCKLYRAFVCIAMCTHKHMRASTSRHP